MQLQEISCKSERFEDISKLGQFPSFNCSQFTSANEIIFYESLDCGGGLWRLIQLALRGRFGAKASTVVR